MIKSTNIENYPRKPIHKNLKRKPVSFGQITPEHLFIKIDQYGRNYKWANQTCDLIHHLAKEIKSKNIDFTDFMEVLKKEYGIINKDEWFCSVRNEEKSLSFSLGEKFKSYLPRLKEYMHSLPESMLIEPPFPDLRYRTNQEIINGKNIVVQNYEIFKTSKKDVIRIKHTDTQNLYDVWKELENTFDSSLQTVIELRKPNNTHKNFGMLNKNIAKFHWLFTNARVFDRGSAGSADIVTKAIYEAANIQVTPWKKGVAPDLEAIVSPLAKYTQAYQSLMEQPLTQIKTSKVYELV